MYFAIYLFGSDRETLVCLVRLNSSTYPCGKFVWILMAALASATETPIAGSGPVMEEPYFIKGSDISFPSLLRDQVLRVVQRCSI